MLECLIIGDSIAVGVGTYSPECKTIARVGINSKNYVAAHINYIPSARKTIISLGSNDGRISYEKQLRKLRSSIHGRVIWLLSAYDRKSAATVKKIAAANGDGVIDITSVPLARDHVHPTVKGYKKLAAAVAQW